MPRFIFFIFFTFCLISLDAQPPGKGGRSGGPQGFFVTGQVVEAASQQAIDYATVSIYSNETGELITGTTTSDGGIFRIKSETKEIYLEVSFIGYSAKRIDKINFTGMKADVGVISLGADAEMLDEVVISQERSTTEFKLDKRVFNVGNDLASSGGSALEVLNSVPSVNVSIEGAITLRGSSGVQILINGKPSVLADTEGGALGSITADMIEKVEVITNPSAKYEAEGTAGIINIVLKKEEKKGINGSVTLNTGIPHNHSIGFSLNNRTEKFNLFTQLGAGYKELGYDALRINTNYVTGQTIESIGREFRNEIFYNVILGSDYYINPLNVITLSGRFTYEVEDQPSNNSFDLINADDSIIRSWSRSEVTEALNPKLQFEFNYKKDFVDHEDHDFVFSIIGNFFGKEQSSVFSEQLLLGEGDLDNQITATAFDEGKYTFNADYTKPFNDNWTLETGAQYVTNAVSNDFTVSDLVGDEYVVDPGLTNVFKYDQDVLGLYGTGAYQGLVWGLKAGLRVENTDLHTLLQNTGEENTRNFTDYFPSLHTSYKVSPNISLQGGYSRRIYRPRLWDLNPFFNIRNTFSIRAGNPNLLPEYTDSYEVGSIFIFDKVTWNLNAYYRYTTDKISRVSIFTDNVNVTTPQNIGTNKTTGLELNFKYTPIKVITLTGDANYNIFNRQGEFNDQNFDFVNDQWSTKITGKYKVSKAFDIEVTGRYQSEEQTIQGFISDNLFADIGMRYKINKGKMVINLSVRDVFASRVRESFADTDAFYAFSTTRYGRFINLGFSYGFGKGEAMQYGGGRRR